jgi:hypothetical protein
MTRGAGVDAALVRRVWQVGEMVHGLTYFAPEVRAATSALGIRGGWRSYFGCRAAPLGAVSAATVTAIFYSFAPSFVAQSVPEVWRHASPEQLLHARHAGIETALRRVFADPGGNGGDPLRAAAAPALDPAVATELAVRAAATAEVSGRPLAAANAALPSPESPYLRLWQALTTLREHRGDGHVTLLVARDIGPVEALVLAAASGRSSAEALRTNRAWSEEEWARAEDVLVARGWLTEDGALTREGSDAREDLEEATDALAAGPYRVLGDAGTAALIAALRPLADRLVGSGAVPVPNPVGVPWPPEDAQPPEGAQSPEDAQPPEEP